MPRQLDRFMLTNSAARRLSVSLIGCVLAVDLAWLPFSALSLSADSLVVIVTIILSFFLAGPLRRRYAFSLATENLAVELYILVLFGAVGFLFSYLAIENGWAVRDEWFAAVDQALGFDWLRYRSFFLQHELLRRASMVLYVISPLLIGFGLFWFCLKGRFDCASKIVAMVILGGVICVVVSGIVPSAGGVGHFGTDSGAGEGHAVVFDSAYKSTFFRLREGSGMEVSLLRPFALIAFPSYHACLSLLIILAFRDAGSVGMAVLAVNVGSLLSLPVQGGHHLTDVLGGLLVGAIVYWAVCRWSSGGDRPLN